MGRHIDPSRRSLPFIEWPASDQAAWRQAVQTGDILDGQGPAAAWAPRTKETNIQHYGRWLGWLTWTGVLEDQSAPSDRMTQQRVSAYLSHLRKIVAPRTQLSMLVGLKVTIQVMEPTQPWRWLQDACNRLQMTAEPSRNKRLLVLPTDQIYAAAGRELERTIDAPTNLKGAIAYRDALMLALLATRPIRVKNMTSILIGTHLIRQGANWQLNFEAREVKNRVALEYNVPTDLVEYLEHYLEHVRPVFLGANECKHLWLNQYGSQLGRHFIYRRIVALTKKLVGQRINPHLLRDCAATTLAVNAPEIVSIARPLLGHRQAETTERNYNQAKQLESGRRIREMLAILKSQARGAQS